MSQRSYLVKRQIYFSNGTTYVRPGDILTHDEANAGKVAIYRGGNLIGAVHQTTMGIRSLLAQRVPLIQEIFPDPKPEPGAKSFPKQGVKPTTLPPPAKVVTPKTEVPKPVVAAVVTPEIKKVVAPIEETSTLVAPVEDTPQEKVDSLAEVKLAELTKAQIAEHAQSLGLKLDPNNLNKPAMIAAVEKHLGTEPADANPKDVTPTTE
jgi:hypothetical protein